MATHGIVLEAVAICPRCGIHIAENADGEYWCHGCHRDYTSEAERFKSEHEQDGRGSQADKLVRMFLAAKPALFHDERGTPYARFQGSPHQTVRLRSMEFRAMLAGLLWKTERKAPGSEALTSALNVLHHIALSGPMIPLHNRIAWHEGAIWIDLADDPWRAVRVTQEGWTVESNVPTLFRRHAQQLPLPEPARGGDAWRLLDFLNVRQEDRALFMVYAASCLIPGVPIVALALHGPQGSAKTTLMTLLKDLFDPSAVGVATLPRDERELIQALDHSYLCYFDNASSLPDWASDALCRATTGTGFSKRQLYTDDDDIIYRLQRPVGLNGINIAAQRPDLLDRSLLIGLEHIPEDKRRTMAEVRTEFKRQQRAMLGGFLDAVVKALSMPEPKFKRTYRMADFVSWGYRLAEGLGFDGEKFVEAYAENVRLQAEEAVNADIVAEVLLAHLEACKDQAWEGTATQLLNELRLKAEDVHVGTRQRTWPKAPNALRCRLKLLRDPLAKVGYSVVFTREGHRGTRIIHIERSIREVPELPSASSASSATTPQSAPPLPSPQQIERSADSADGPTLRFVSVPGHNTEPESDQADRLTELEGISQPGIPLRDLILQTAVALNRERGEVGIEDLEARLAGKASRDQILGYMGSFVSGGLFDVLDWGRWRSLR
jgi:hypothetical protein